VGSDLVSRILTGNEFQTLGAENRKARDPNVNLWQGTKSWWELDERRDLLGSWCCRRSERYGRRSVCRALKVIVARLNRIRHSIGSQWSCLSNSFEGLWFGCDFSDSEYIVCTALWTWHVTEDYPISNELVDFCEWRSTNIQSILDFLEIQKCFPKVQIHTAKQCCCWTTCYAMLLFWYIHFFTKM